MKVVDIPQPAADRNAATGSAVIEERLGAVCPNRASHRPSRGQVINRLVDQSDLFRSKLKHVIKPAFRQVLGRKRARASPLRDAMQQMPLLRAERTYNTSHPDYDGSLVRNYPGRILNYDLGCENISFRALIQLSRLRRVPNRAWKPVFRAALAEASSVPHSKQVFERRAFVEHYVGKLTSRYGAHYVPGWVNLNDALFLYWLVRQAKPRTIVQTGVCNGLSAAFMMLALVKNGPEGRLRVIDLPPVFNPADPAWTVKGTVYGVVIPEGKSSGWLVPDAYRDRFEVWNGDAKELLPALVDAVDSIDFFFHDSDHTYDHMMFEFHEVKRKLDKGGLVVSDDVSWNASLWDFADEFQVPAYNFQGTVGVAFL